MFRVYCVIITHVELQRALLLLFLSCTLSFSLNLSVLSLILPQPLEENSVFLLVYSNT